MNILFLGDSLVEYHDWAERLPGHRVANLGIAGESVQGLLSRVIRIGEVFPEADMIFIMTGINNIAMGDLDITGYYKVILDKLRARYSGADLYIHSLLPAAVDFISPQDVLDVNHALRSLAQEQAATYIDLHSRFTDAQGAAIREYLVDDGVHVSRAGYDVWACLIAEIVESRQT
jgi:lysophospholipase L1-like esterase